MKEQLTNEFQALRPQLKSFILRLTASPEDAEDIAQETYIKALEKIDTFRGESSLKTWLFAIASNLAKDAKRAKKRWSENVTDICRAEAMVSPSYISEMLDIHTTSPWGQFEIKEHIAFCLTCISKSLPLEQQICMLLKEVYGFMVAEISQIIDSSEAMVKYYLYESRKKMADIFDGRCALINKEGTCHQCSELNGLFNPKQNFEIEKNKIAMARAIGDSDIDHLLDLRFQILKEIDPFSSNGSELQMNHIQYNRKIMENI